MQFRACAYDTFVVMSPSKTPAALEEDRLVAEWAEAGRERFALYAELNKQTFSRLYESQVELLRAAKAADAKCQGIMVALRAHRELMRNKS